RWRCGTTGWVDSWRHLVGHPTEGGWRHGPARVRRSDQWSRRRAQPGGRPAHSAAGLLVLPSLLSNWLPEPTLTTVLLSPLQSLRLKLEVVRKSLSWTLSPVAALAM